MLQNESSEVYGIDDFISVRKWLADPNGSKTGRVDRDLPPVLLARSAVVFVRVEGHFLHLHTVTGGEYVRRGTLKGLHQRWAEYGLVRIHSRYLVFLAHVRELRHEPDGPVVLLAPGAGVELLPISRDQFQEATQLWKAHKRQRDANKSISIGSELCMGEAIQLSAVKRDWRMPCYDSAGVVRVCTVDSDHGAVRIGLSGGDREEFFELRVGQVDEFWAGLVSTLGMIRSGGSEGTSHWRGQCYTQWGERSDCVIEVREQGAIRIAWITVVAGVVTVLPGARERSLELRGEQVGVFEAALTAAMKVCHADIVIHGRHWADDETEVASSPGMAEAEFVTMIYEMAAADAPRRFAIMGEIGDRVDAIKLAWGLKLSEHHIEVVSIGSDHVRASFSSLENAWKVFSINGKVKIRIVPVDEPQRQTEAA